MYYAFTSKNILPQQFRKISASDWDVLNRVDIAVKAKQELYKERIKMEAEMKAEMRSRMR